MPLRTLLRFTVIASALAVSFSLDLNGNGQAEAQVVDDPRLYCAYRDYGQPDLFYNYYVPPNCGGLGAQLYVAPLPVPPNVGHTFYTYQPLLPHEYMYPHQRTYRRYYDGGRGMNRTRVVWYHSPLGVAKDALQNFHLAR